MPLFLYTDIYSTGSVPQNWKPTRGGVIKYPVHNKAVLRELRRLQDGRWRKVISKGNTGEVHYFEHASGQVAGVKYLPRI